MVKKGQVTIYIIIGLVLIIGVSMFFIFSGDVADDESSTLPRTQDSNSLNLYIENCLSETLTKGIYELGLSGGYVQMPLSTFYNIDYGYASLHYNLGDLSIPTINEMQTNLEGFIEDEILYCLMHFNEFMDIGYEVDTGEMNSDVTIADNDVSVSLNYPVTLIRDEETINVNTFNARSNTRVKQVWEAGNEIIEALKEEPYYIHSTENLNIMDDYDLKIDTFSFPEFSNVVYSIEDPNSLLWEPDVNYLYVFAIEYEDYVEEIPEEFTDDFLDDLADDELIELPFYLEESQFNVDIEEEIQINLDEILVINEEGDFDIQVFEGNIELTLDNNVLSFEESESGVYDFSIWIFEDDSFMDVLNFEIIVGDE